MNLFGIGPTEMLVIAVIALIVFGPGKLPEVMGQAGKAIRDFRRMTADLTGEFEKTIGTDLNDMRQQITGGLSGLTSEVNNVSESVKRDLASASGSSTNATASSSSTYTPPSPPSSSTESTGSASTAVTGSSSSTNGTKLAPPKPVASKRDPLADVSFMDDVAGQNGQKHEAIAAESTSHKEEPVRIAANGVTSEAVARARQRRQSAGYGKRSPGRIN